MGDFGWAAAELKQGSCVQREGWAAKGIRLALIPPAFAITLPFIAVRRSSGDVAPWQACHNDLLATDWVAVKDGSDG